MRYGILLAVLSLMAPASFAAVGRTAGGFDVSSVGSANYTIPIWLPPGPKGMQPNLALTYNSGNANGVLGIGWSLSGLSSIERCNRSVAQDGSAGGVQLAMSDRFCLNGNRLRLVSGTYGVAGSTYRLESDDYSTITAYGTAGNGPEYFEQRDKDGNRFLYGATTSSRVFLGSSTTAYRWKLSRAADATGNNYVVSYVNTNGYAMPSTISWAPASAGSLTYVHQANFNYITSRTAQDTITGFVANQQVSNSSRLEDIQIQSTIGGVTQTVRRYFLSYDTGPITQRSRLTQIKECSNDAATDCLSPTTVSYQAGLAGLAGAALSGPGSSSTLIQGHFDFNGDQRDDLLYVVSGAWHVAFAVDGGFSTPVSTGIPSASRPIPDRYTAGQDGLLVAVSGVWWHYRWNGSSFPGVSTGTAVTTALSTTTADTNGDGLSDLVWLNSSAQAYIRLNTTAGSAATPTFSSTATLAATLPPSTYQIRSSPYSFGVRRLDFDGDGRQDLYATYTLSEPFTFSLNMGLYSRGTTLETAPQIAGVHVVAVNFNDDKCTDQLLSAVVYISPCANSAGTSVTLPSTPITVLDWNGDGRTDFAVNNGGTIGIYRSVGTGISSLEATSIPYSSSYSYFAVDQDGDSLEDLVRVGTASPYAVSFFSHTASGAAPPFATNVPDLATNFVDGFGVSHTVGYVSTGRSNYTPGAAATAPLSNMADALIVVAQLTSTDATGGSFNRSYSYSGGRRDDRRMSFAGFEQRTQSDARNNLIQRDTYEQLFPLTGRVKKRELLQSNGTTLISELSNTHQSIAGGSGNDVRAYPYLQQSIAKRWEVGGAYNGVLLSTATTTNTVDAATGAVTATVTSVLEGSTANGVYAAQTHTTAKNITLFNDFANSCFGKPQTLEEKRSHTAANGALITRNTSFTWSGANCRLDQQIVEPGSVKWQVTTGYAYDSFGNVSGETVTPAAGQGQSARTTQINWGTTGQFPQSITNALSQVTAFGWNQRTGFLEAVTDPNLRTTYRTNDNFGRQLTEVRPDGTKTTYTLTACNSSNSYCGIGSSDLRYSLTAAYQDTASATFKTDVQYYDGLDRTRVADAQLLGGINSRSITTYNSRGLIATQSTPYTPMDPVWYTSYSYDALNRVTLARRPKHEGDSSNHDTIWSYEGLSTKTTNARALPTTAVRTAWGSLVRVTDATNSNTDYQYDAFGNLRKTIDPASNEIAMTYTARGLKLTSTDPDMGSWSYDYYPLGELKSQTDAKSQTVTFSYDALSRLRTRVEPEGTTTFVWDPTNGIGQLAEAFSSATTCTTAGVYCEAYQYDSMGRATQMTVRADNTAYAYNYSYNATTGFLETMTYPTSSPSFRLKLRYAYDTGQLKSIQNYTGDVAGTTLWNAQAVNARGQIILETFGNGLSTSSGYDRITGWLDDLATGPSASATIQNFSYLWDESGNLTQRYDGKAGTTETFYYDSLERLYESRRNGSAVLNVGYDAIGNINSKTGVGTYTYHGTKKHAVTATTSGGSYSYDANGNMESGGGNTITYYSNNLTKRVSGNGTISDFWYGPTGARWKLRTDTAGYIGNRTYIGPFVERLVTPATNEFRHFVYSPTGPVAMYKRPSSGSGPVWWYMTTDHLGSTDVITNYAGTEQVNLSFTAFGERRAADGISAPTAADTTAYKTVTLRGFTFHEHLDQQGLIHMNGRVYDPKLGRFTSADPFVQAPFNPQSLNRYSYTFNNPLSYVDPSGFACWHSERSYNDADGMLVIEADRFDTCDDFVPWWNPTYSGVEQGGGGGSWGDDVSDGTVGGAPNPLVNGSESSWSPLNLFGISTANAAENSRLGLIHWETDTSNPFAASPIFTRRFSGTPEELALATTVVMINAGSLQVREVLGASDLALPGGRKALFDIYSVGPPNNPGPGRIANVRGTNIYYYSPYHYRPGPDVPNTWIKITYPAPTGR